MKDLKYTVFTIFMILSQVKPAFGFLGFGKDPKACAPVSLEGSFQAKLSAEMILSAKDDVYQWAMYQGFTTLHMNSGIYYGDAYEIVKFSTKQRAEELMEQVTLSEGTEVEFGDKQGGWLGRYRYPVVVKLPSGNREFYFTCLKKECKILIPELFSNDCKQEGAF